jgi:hypothetical protein
MVILTLSVSSNTGQDALILIKRLDRLEIQSSKEKGYWVSNREIMHFSRLGFLSAFSSPGVIL